MKCTSLPSLISERAASCQGCARGPPAAGVATRWAGSRGEGEGRPVCRAVDGAAALQFFCLLHPAALPLLAPCCPAAALAPHQHGHPAPHHAVVPAPLLWCRTTASASASCGRPGARCRATCTRCLSGRTPHSGSCQTLGATVRGASRALAPTGCSRLRVRRPGAAQLCCNSHARTAAQPSRRALRTLLRKARPCCLLPPCRQHRHCGWARCQRRAPPARLLERCVASPGAK